MRSVWSECVCHHWYNGLYVFYNDGMLLHLYSSTSIKREFYGGCEKNVNASTVERVCCGSLLFTFSRTNGFVCRRPEWNSIFSRLPHHNDVLKCNSLSGASVQPISFLLLLPISIVAPTHFIPPTALIFRAPLITTHWSILIDNFPIYSARRLHRWICAQSTAIVRCFVVYSTIFRWKSLSSAGFQRARARTAFQKRLLLMQCQTWN